jgi:hypothetical protein
MKFKDRRYINFPNQDAEPTTFKVVNLSDLGFDDYDYLSVNININDDNTLSINFNENSKKAIKIMEVPEENIKTLYKAVRTHLNENNLVTSELLERVNPYANHEFILAGIPRNPIIPVDIQNMVADYNIDDIDLNNYQNIIITNIFDGVGGADNNYRNIFIDDLGRLNNDNELHLKLKKSILWYLHENVPNGTLRYFDNNRLISSNKGHSISFIPNDDFFEIYGEPDFGHYTDSLVELYGVMEIPFNGQINHQIIMIDYLED